MLEDKKRSQHAGRVAVEGSHSLGLGRTGGNSEDRVIGINIDIDVEFDRRYREPTLARVRVPAGGWVTLRSIGLMRADTMSGGTGPRFELVEMRSVTPLR